MGIEKERTEAASKTINKFVQQLQKRFGLRPVRGGTPTERKHAVMNRLDKKFRKAKRKGKKLRGE